MNTESCVMHAFTIVRGHLKGAATVHKPHVHYTKWCLWSQGISIYPRVHESSMATVVFFSKLWTHNYQA